MAMAEPPRLAPIPAGAAPPAAAVSSALAPPRFPSHRDPGVSATLDPRAFALCEIVATAPVADIESTLQRSGIPPLAELVDPVIRLSYSRPAAAVRFFRWSGVSRRHRPSAWTLMIDLLGRNALFDAMWDAVRSARDDGALSPATFASVFSSYCAAGRFRDAAMTFDVMDRYGVPKDAFVVNSLLAAVLREGGTASDAAEMYDRVKSSAAADGDTFAILLEGWEREGNAARAKTTFGEMIVRVGWDAKNMSAYDAFLNTLVGAGEADEAIKFLRVMQSKGCLPGLKFFTNALGNLVKQGDAKHATEFWEIMVEGAGLVPNLAMYNAVITLLCSKGDSDSAFRLLDEMPVNGAFPDSHTYNTIFECLLRTKKVRESERFLVEMRKNEFPPTPNNCSAAVWMFFDRYDPEAAAEVWRCAVEDRVWPLGECANQLLVGLRDLGRMSDARRYAEEMLDMGIEITKDTMEKLKSGFEKARKEEVYERLERRWKKGKGH